MRHLTVCLILLLASTLAVEAAQTRTLRKAPRHQVELFVTSWCPYCEKAKTFFDARGIPYQLYDVEKNPKAARRKATLSPGRGVPLAIIDGVVISGWSQRAYETALDQ